MPSIYRYRVFMRPDGRFHVIGYDEATASTHVSPPLVNFDSAALTGRTQDGIEYKLTGYPARDLSAGATWARYCAQNDLTGCTDVTP